MQGETHFFVSLASSARVISSCPFTVHIQTLISSQKKIEAAHFMAFSNPERPKDNSDLLQLRSHFCHFDHQTCLWVMKTALFQLIAQVCEHVLRQWNRSRMVKDLIKNDLTSLK